MSAQRAGGALALALVLAFPLFVQSPYVLHIAIVTGI